MTGIREMTAGVEVAVKERKTDTKRVGLYLTADLEKQKEIADDILEFQNVCKQGGKTPSVELYKLVKLYISDEDAE